MNMLVVRYNPGSAIQQRWLNREYGNWDLDGYLSRAQHFATVDQAEQAIREMCIRTELIESNFEVVRVTFEVVKKGSAHPYDPGASIPQTSSVSAPPTEIAEALEALRSYLDASSNPYDKQMADFAGVAIKRLRGGTK